MVLDAAGLCEKAVSTEGRLQMMPNGFDPVLEKYFQTEDLIEIVRDGLAPI
jgi:hypothetical protein